MQNHQDWRVVKKYHELFHSAQSRGIHFDLSLRRLRQILKQEKCFFTGVKLSNDGDTKRTIDRIDASKGYVDSNVVACSLKFNHKKKDLTFAEIEVMYRKIKRKLKQTKKL